MHCALETTKYQYILVTAHRKVARFLPEYGACNDQTTLTAEIVPAVCCETAQVRNTRKKEKKSVWFSDFIYVEQAPWQAQFWKPLT